MKTWKIFWGLGFVLAAVLIMLDALGFIAPIVSVVGEISVFAIIAGLLLFAFIITRLIKGKLLEIFFPLAFIFMLFEKNIAKLAELESENIINNWLVLLIAMLLSIGFAILFPSRKRRKNRKFHGTRGGTVEINGKRAESNLGSSTIYIDCEDFSPSNIENNFGSCAVYFKNVEKYEGGKTLYVENNFGPMCINIPSEWIVKTSIENNMGGTHTANDEDKAGPILYIKGENNFGSLSVRYV